MSELKVNSIKGVGASTAAITVNNTDGTASANLTSVSGGQFGNRNMIHNGEFVVSQRDFSSAVTQTGEAFTIDRWKTRMNINSKFSVQQVVDAPAGFYNSAKITSLAATTVGANDYYQFQHCIEGYNLNPANFGTATAKALVFSFYVKSSLTGAFSVGFSNNAGDRYFVQNYTISSAGTWERKTISIPAITTGSWNRGNTEGLFIYFTLGAGSNTLKSTGSWGTSFGRGGTGGGNIVATNAATWQVTGVQLEINDTGVATNFEHKSFGQELALCQRYYYRHATGADTSNDYSIATFATYQTNDIFGMVDLPVTMRANPSIDQVTGSSYYKVYRDGGSDAFDSFGGVWSASPTCVGLNANSGTGVSGCTAGHATFVKTNNTSAYLAFSAEL